MENFHTGFILFLGYALNGQSDTLTLFVYLQNCHLYYITHLHDLRGVLDLSVTDLGDMDKAILVDTDVYEHTKVNYISYRAGQNHTNL